MQKNIYTKQDQTRVTPDVKILHNLLRKKYIWGLLCCIMDVQCHYNPEIYDWNAYFKKKKKKEAATDLVL